MKQLEEDIEIRIVKEQWRNGNVNDILTKSLSETIEMNFSIQRFGRGNLIAQLINIELISSHWIEHILIENQLTIYIRMDLQKNSEQEEITFIIVLGLKLKYISRDKYEMENFLIDRLELTNRIFQSNLIDEKQHYVIDSSKSCIILSGRGQVGNESHLMRDYLKRAYKYEDHNLLAEENSMTTVENFVFSFYHIWNRFEKTLKDKKFRIYVVTSDYHKERSQYILECFLPKLQKAFTQNSITEVKYYGSITHTKEESYLQGLSQEQIDEFQDSNFNWSQFAYNRYFNKEEELNSFLEYSKFFKNKD